jgi:hypothetical protein
MTALSRTFGDLPTPAIVALIALGVVQLTLQIIALVDLARRPAVAGGRKWVWVVVATLGGLIGASAYLAIGRKVPALEGSEPQSGAEGARRRALDTLYGSEKPRD